MKTDLASRAETILNSPTENMTRPRFSLEGGDYSALDLNILCFNQDFVSQKDIDNSKKVSAAFVSDYIDAHGIDKFHKLLISSGTVEGADIFSRELSQFYAKNNIDYLPSTVLYALGGHSYDYIAKCRYAEFYIENGWYDENNKLNLLTYENFLHQNYADVKKFFEINSEQMGKYQLLLGFEEYNNDLKVYFSNSKRLSQYSFYQRGKHSIYLMNVDSLMHEYIHSVTVENNPSDSGWSVEGAARYFSYKYDYYGIAMLNADYNKPSSGKETLYVQEYKEKNRSRHKHGDRFYRNRKHSRVQPQLLRSELQLCCGFFVCCLYGVAAWRG